MRFRYTLERPDGRTFARNVSADNESDAAVLCDQVWRAAGLDPQSDDPSIDIKFLPDA